METVTEENNMGKVFDLNGKDLLKQEGIGTGDSVIPEKLPNPYPLTFTGGASGSYDGSKALTINIPSGGDGITYYVTPEQFGAIGDGVTDDSEAFRQAIETEKPIVCTYGKKYNCIT